MLIKATIPICHPVEENGKSYTVFVIEFYYLGRLYKVEKRYRTFHSLHKQLKKVIETPEFPPKRVRNWNPRVLEQRRKDLERYLQIVLKFSPVPKTLQGFLGIPAIVQNGSSESLIDDAGKENVISHQPVVTFITEPFLTSQSPGCLPDIVVMGVMQGLYNDTYLMASTGESKSDDSEN